MKKLLQSKNGKILALSVVVVLVVLLIVLLSVFLTRHHHKKPVSHEKFSHEPNKLVLYHLEGCHHCEKLMPVWNSLKQKHGNMMLDFEAKQHPELMKLHWVQSYPTIMMNGHKYEGDRSYQDLEKFMMTHMEHFDGSKGNGDTIIYIVIGIFGGGLFILFLAGIYTLFKK